MRQETSPHSGRSGAVTRRALRRGAAGAAIAVLAGASCAQNTVQFRPDFDTVTDPVPFDVKLGDSFDLGDPGNVIRLVILNIDAFDQTPERFPRLRVAVRSENVSDRTLNNPDVQLFCDEATSGGGYHGGSTWEMNAVIKPGEFREGELYLGFPPKDSNPQYSIASCSNPRIIFTGTNWNTRQQFQARFEVPVEVIDAAIEARIGVNLPLPPPAR